MGQAASTEDTEQIIGPTGPIGPKGDRGDIGPTGPKGDRGDKGDQGLLGPEGPAGPEGPVGPAGIDGKDGLPGPTGPRGLRGEVGLAGPQGEVGDIGPIGPTGPIGLRGLRGELGPMGPAGPTGPTGATGIKGDTGPTGRPGLAVWGDFSDNDKKEILGLISQVAGLRGPTGPQGIQGPQGAPGLTEWASLTENNKTEILGLLESVPKLRGQEGPTGPAGKDGVAGPQGIEGPAGKDGIPGPAGPAGPQGIEGPAGKDGVPGPAGPAGPAGPKGDKGDIGPPGPAGSGADWFDNRQIKPTDTPTLKTQIGFGSWNNNNGGPWSDVLAFNTWMDASGGAQNLMMLKKDGIGLRLYQGPFGGKEAMTEYRDAVLSDKAGNVGIGKTNPGLRLDVTTSGGGDVARFENTNPGGFGTIELKNPTRSWYVGAGSANSPGFKDRFYILAGGGPGNNFVINPNGNIGIGTENPEAKLQVSNGRLRVDDPNNSVLELKTKDKFSYLFTEQNGALKMYPGATTDHTIINPPGGGANVGIGTNDPKAKLDVEGTVNATKFTIGGKELTASSDFDAFTNGHDGKFSEGWVVAANWPWDTTIRGDGRTGYAHTIEEWDTPAENRTADYAVPKDMRSGYLIHLAWMNCRWFDILGVLPNDQVRFITRVNNYNPHDGGGEVHSGISIVPIPGVNRFKAIRLRGGVGRIHSMGIGWTRGIIASGNNNGFIHGSSIFGGKVHASGYHVTGPGIGRRDGKADAVQAPMLEMMQPGTHAVQNSVSANITLGAREADLNAPAQMRFRLSGGPNDANGWGGNPNVDVMTLNGDGNVIVQNDLNANNHVRGKHGVFGHSHRTSIEDHGSFGRIAFKELRFWDHDNGDMVTFNNNNVGVRGNITSNEGDIISRGTNLSQEVLTSPLAYKNFEILHKDGSPIWADGAVLRGNNPPGRDGGSNAGDGIRRWAYNPYTKQFVTSPNNTEFGGLYCLTLANSDLVTNTAGTIITHPCSFPGEDKFVDQQFLINDRRIMVAKDPRFCVQGKNKVTTNYCQDVDDVWSFPDSNIKLAGPHTMFRSKQDFVTFGPNRSRKNFGLTPIGSSGALETSGKINDTIYYSTTRDRHSSYQRFVHDPVTLQILVRVTLDGFETLALTHLRVNQFVTLEKPDPNNQNQKFEYNNITRRFNLQSDPTIFITLGKIEQGLGITTSRVSTSALQSFLVLEDQNRGNTPAI